MQQDALTMSETLHALKIFTRVARTGSFSRAARELGLPQPSVSRTIAELERVLETKLLVRTTRAVVLTEAGTDYLQRIEPILAALEEANQALRSPSGLQGTLRVGVPVSIAIREIIPQLPQFSERHPALRLELQLKDEFQDLLRDGVDVAVRLGALKDSTATSRVVGVNQRVVAASPAYLERAGTPATPAELARHRILIAPPGETSDAWTFERDGKTVSIRVESHLKTNINEAATAAAVAGLGIVSTGLWGCRAELARGSLVRILTDWNMGSTQAHALFPAGRATKPSARLFVEFLIEVFKR
jgi:molybdate transport repressor ModE-like protein